MQSTINLRFHQARISLQFCCDEYVRKDLMEDKQLDFSRPLLSVRRFSSTVAPQDAVRGGKVDNSLSRIPSPPAYRPEWKSGPVGNPGTVPFQWEQSPGRPKDVRNFQNHPSERPPLIPKLPPGRTMNAKRHDADKNCKVVQLNAKVANSRCQNILEGKSSSRSDYDEAYLDALDDLTRTESSLTRSLSSLSRLDGLDVDVSGALTDPQTLDIMMGRFLPAAKAIVSESPHHPSRKWPAVVVREPPREVIKAVSKIKPHPVKRQPPNLMRHHMQNEAGLRMQSATPLPAGHRSRIDYSFADYFGGTDGQLAMDAANEQELEGGQKNQDLHTDETLRKRDYLKLDGSSQYRHVQGTTAVSSGADNSWKKELDQQRKGPYILRVLLATDQNGECELPSVSPVVEKTLYIDPVHKEKSQNSKFSAPKESPNLKQDNRSPLDEHTEVRTDPSHQVFQLMNGANVDARLTPQTTVSGNSYSPSCAKINPYMQIDTKKCLRPKPDILQGSQVPDDRKIDFEKRVPKDTDKGSTNGSCTQLSLPPLPNSPSESWLQRTLPTLSLKNPSKSSFGTLNYMKNQSSKSPVDHKWETLVKTSNTYNDQLRFSQELLTPIPEA